MFFIDIQNKSYCGSRYANKNIDSEMKLMWTSLLKAAMLVKNVLDITETGKMKDVIDDANRVLCKGNPFVVWQHHVKRSGSFVTNRVSYFLHKIKLYRITYETVHKSILSETNNTTTLYIMYFYIF